MYATNDLKVLENLNLTENQARLYLAFLNNRNKTVAQVARQIEMDKSSAYRAAEELLNLGLLIAKSKKRGTTCSAADPDNLKDLLALKQQEVKSQEFALNGLIEKIRQSSFNLQRNTFIKVEKGIDAHIKCMEESLEVPNITIREKFNMDLPIHYDKDYVNYVHTYVKRRIQKHISIKELGGMNTRHLYGEIMSTSKKFLKEIRLIPDNILDKNDLRIYNDQVEILSFDEINDFIVVSIKDKYLTDLMKNMFDFVWERSEVY